MPRKSGRLRRTTCPDTVGSNNKCDQRHTGGQHVALTLGTVATPYRRLATIRSVETKAAKAPKLTGRRGKEGRRRQGLGGSAEPRRSGALASSTTEAAGGIVVSGRAHLQFIFHLACTLFICIYMSAKLDPWHRKMLISEIFTIGTSRYRLIQGERSLRLEIYHFVNFRHLYHVHYYFTQGPGGSKVEAPVGGGSSEEQRRWEQSFFGYSIQQRAKQSFPMG